MSRKTRGGADFRDCTLVLGAEPRVPGIRDRAPSTWNSRPSSEVNGSGLTMSPSSARFAQQGRDAISSTRMASYTPSGLDE